MQANNITNILVISKDNVIRFAVVLIRRNGISKDSMKDVFDQSGMSSKTL